jgi:four helix bundle protein
MSPDQLQNRLTRFAISVCSSVRIARRDPVSVYYTGQLIRSSTSPGANYSEATDAESRRDFIHKMKLCLKELRETHYWLQFKSGVAAHDSADDALVKECDELIAIFVSSIKSARE